MRHAEHTAGLVLCAMLTSTSGAAEAPSPCSPDAMKAIERHLWEADGKTAEPLVRACLKQDASSLPALAGLDNALNAPIGPLRADRLFDRILVIGRGKFAA